MVSIVVALFTLLPMVCRSVLFPTFSPAFAFVCVIGDSHSDWREVESQCSFDLHFLYDQEF
jgi:hypothetical protein